jgi:hypothetical protein
MKALFAPHARPELTGQRNSAAFQEVRLFAARRAHQRAQGDAQILPTDTLIRALPGTTTGHVATSIAHGVHCPDAHVAVSSDYLSDLADAHVSGPA